MFQQVATNTIVNLFYVLIFLMLHYGAKNGIKKPLFCVIIKLQAKLKLNRGVFTMSFSNYSLRQKLQKIKSTTKINLDWVREQANKKPIVAPAPMKKLEFIPADEPTGEVLKDISPTTGKPRKWKQHKSDNLKLVQLYEEASKKFPHLITAGRLWDMQQCADTLQFVRYADGSKKLYKAYFCRNRLCPMCQWRRSLKLFGQVSKISDWLLEKSPDMRFLFVTFTQANCTGQELGSEFTKINKAFTRLTDKTKNVTGARTLQKSMLGFIKSTEVTYNSKTQTYHPHLHVVFAVHPNYFKTGNYISAPAWRTVWQDVLKLDYLPQVNVQAIKITNKKAVAELTKYPAKVTSVLDLPTPEAVQVLADLTMFCRNRRFVSYGGCFKTAKQELHLQDVEAKDADLVTTGDNFVDNLNPVGRTMYKYNSKFGCYIA